MNTAPRKYTAEEKADLITQALELLKNDLTVTEAAQSLGVGKSTLYDWLAAYDIAEQLKQHRRACARWLPINPAAPVTRACSMS